MKFIIEYDLPYTHRVRLGSQASTPAQAFDQAQASIDNGTLWTEDSGTTPLLCDTFEEDGDAGVPLGLTIVDVFSDGEPWPEPDESIVERNRREAAFEAARLLAFAYKDGEDRGGSIKWEILNDAYAMALKALPPD